MPEYKYWATTEIGDTVTGQLNASSPDAAAHLLTLRGLTAQRFEEVAAPSAGQPAPVESVSLTDDDFAGLGSALETATRTSLPLTTSLRTLAEESRSSRLRRAVMSMIAALEEGRPLDQVLRRLPSAFPARISALVDAGVKTGKLPFLMHHALEHLRRAAALRRRIWRSLAYPALIFLVATGIIAGILLVLVPTFKRIFDDFGTELPGLTKVIVGLSDVLVDLFHGIGQVGMRLGGPLALALVIALLAALGGGLYLLGRLQPFSGVRRVWHLCLNLIPVVGPVFRTASLSNLFRLMAMLVEAGIALPEALRLAAAVTDDAALAPGVNRISESLEHGVGPLDAVRNSEALPREVLPIFRWADNRTLFIEALRGAADIYAARSQLHAGITAVILEPALIFGIGITVGLVFMALFLPLIKLLNDLA